LRRQIHPPFYFSNIFNCLMCPDGDERVAWGSATHIKNERKPTGLALIYLAISIYKLADLGRLKLR